MIPHTSYPEAKAKARVITLADQLNPTVKTLNKAGTLLINCNKEPGSVDHSVLKKESHIAGNILTLFKDIPCCIRTTEQAGVGNSTNKSIPEVLLNLYPERVYCR